MGKPLHGLARHSVLGTLRRFLGPFSYERELSEVLGDAYGAPGLGAINGALFLEDFSQAVAPATLPRPAILSKIDLRATVVSYVERLGSRGAGDAGV